MSTLFEAKIKSPKGRLLCAQGCGNYGMSTVISKQKPNPQELTALGCGMYDIKQIAVLST